VALPYVDGLLMAVLRPGLPGVPVVTQLPAPAIRTYPVVLARRIGGAQVRHGLLDAPLVQIDCFSTDRRGSALISANARDAIEAAKNQITSDGYIGWVTEVSGPVELRDPDQPNNIFRFSATYELRTRP
jgi:hypothetical protein